MTALKKATAVFLSAILLCAIFTACGDDAEEISMYDLNHEIVAIQVKKKSDLSEAALSLKKHLETRKTLYAAYEKSQLPKLEKAKVFTRGNLAILMVADDSDRMEAAFYNFFKSK